MKCRRHSPGYNAALLAALLTSQCSAFALPPSATSINRDFPCEPAARSGRSAAALGTSNHNDDQEATNDNVVQPEIDLQSQHPRQTPSQTLRNLAHFCDDNDIDTFDVYGDYHLAQDTSYLRKFESEVASSFGMDDAVFMPSGVMAQSIALLIHSRGCDENNGSDNDGPVRRDTVGKRTSTFACHRTSHLLLHEQDGYSDLLGMDAVILPVGTKPCGGSFGGTFGVEPMRLSDVEEAIEQTRIRAASKDEGDESNSLSSVIIELPHREIGGKLTPWDEVVQMSYLCRKNGVAFHCDGARIFEAAAGYGFSLQQIAEPFDSLYISYYKGLGGISGAMLLGSPAFCTEARVWLRRFGGNLYTLLPYAVSAWSGFRARSIGEGGGPTFEDKRDKLRRIVGALSEDYDISSVVTFDPKVPETNMVHGFIRAPLDNCQEGIDGVVSSHGIRALSRIRAISDGEDESKLGYGCRFEWTMGDANAAVEDDVFVRAWKVFAITLAGAKE